jgi:uncharacterized membrane protein YphA (DoxX/SURF4 family)
MTISGALARPMMAGIFVYGGLDALRNPEGKAKAADDVAPLLAEWLHLPVTDTVTLVRINGGVQLVAGSLLAVGKARRISALALAASLAPTTYAGHRYWEEVDEEKRAQQRIHFLKNLAMLGGLILAAGDTGGRPSLPWRAKRAAGQAVGAAVAAGQVTEETARHLLDTTKEAQKAAAAQLSRRARKAARKAQKAELAALVAQARKVAQAAKESDLSKRAVKAATKSAQKAKKADLAGHVQKVAQKAESVAVPATIAAGRAAYELASTRLAPLASAAAAQVQQSTGDALDWAREAAGDGAVGRARDSATVAAHQVVERARDALPVGS